MWKKIRITVLLLFLLAVIAQQYLAQADLAWKKSLAVAIYPINADRSENTAKYIASLGPESFAGITPYFDSFAKEFRLAVQQPFTLQLGTEIRALPAAAPASGSRIDAIIWSLRLRWYAFINAPSVKTTPKIKLYMLFYDPATHPSLPHSTAIKEGRIGVVNLFAQKDYERQNEVIIAHELLHTVGATDKYSFTDNQPIYPQGFGEPFAQPRYPQRVAEIMGGRIALSETSARIPSNLDQTLISDYTAREIKWIN